MSKNYLKEYQKELSQTKIIKAGQTSLNLSVAQFQVKIYTNKAWARQERCTHSHFYYTYTYKYKQTLGWQMLAQSLVQKLSPC